MPDNSGRANNALGVLQTFANAFKTAAGSRTQEANNKANAMQAGRALQVKEDIRSRNK